MNTRAFTRDVDLPGWSGQSVWGYDELLECYWANLWRDDDQVDAPRIAISSYHLIPTPNALARVIADHLGIDDDEAYRAMVKRSPVNRIRCARHLR